MIGMNSIAAYCIAHLFDSFIARNLRTHLGTGFFRSCGTAYEPFLHGAGSAAGVLADPVLDVPTQNLLPDLNARHEPPSMVAFESATAIN